MKLPDRRSAGPDLDEFRHCPHCGRRTRHAIARERVLAPVLWCLACFRTRLGDDEHAAAAESGRRPAPEAERLSRQQ